MPIDGLQPAWPAPSNVRAFSTLRHGGVSRGAWASLNLARHVGDDPAAVDENRRRLCAELALPAMPAWLQQVHGTRVVDVGAAQPCGDGATTGSPGRVCVVMTADCLPVLFCNRAGTRVAAAHAGWRGLLAGVLEATVARFDDPPGEILAWLGPAIGPEAFEVGEDVRSAYLERDEPAARHFRAGRPGHWLADLYGLARGRLQRAGVTAVSGGEYCTYSDPERFFSYRRETNTGRMASLIWLQTSAPEGQVDE
jgi:hypothetical protein